MTEIGDEDLLAYFDERLETGESARIEQRLRESPRLLTRAGRLIDDRDRGGHTLGEIWRRSRASCPGRAVWAAWVDGRLGDAMSQYLNFHLESIGCRYCHANVEDLRHHDSSREAASRVRKIFETSVGRLQPTQQGDVP